MLPLSLFANRLFAMTSLVGLLVNVAFYGLIFVLSLYFQEINDYSPFQTGLAFLPIMGVVLPVNLIAPRLAERIGAIATIVHRGCHHRDRVPRAPLHQAGYALPRMLAQLMALGGGLGLLVPPLTSTLLGSVDKARSGIAAGVLNSTRQTGSVIGVALFGSLLAGQADAFLFGTRAALMISAALLICAAGVAIVGRGAKA